MDFGFAKVTSLNFQAYSLDAPVHGLALISGSRQEISKWHWRYSQQLKSAFILHYMLWGWFFNALRVFKHVVNPEG